MSGNPEQQLHDEADDLVGHQEEQRGNHDEDEDHAGGDHGLAPGRPSDLGHLGRDLANELDGVDHLLVLKKGRRGGPRPPAPRFWSPMLSQLSYPPKAQRLYPPRLTLRSGRRPRLEGWDEP